MNTNPTKVKCVKLFALLFMVGIMATGCRGCKIFGGRGKEKKIDTAGPVTGSTDTGQSDSNVAILRPIEKESNPATELQKIHFDYDSAQLTAQANEALLENLEWLKSHPDLPILIEGHCDERGTIQYNLSLGERRANSVRNFLVRHGIESDRLFIISYGEERPVGPGYGEEHWWKNRRAEFKRYE